MQHRESLEMYGFLIFWVIGITEQKATSRAAAAEKTGKVIGHPSGHQWSIGS